MFQLFKSVLIKTNTMKTEKIKSPPSNWIIFDILIRVMGFPFFLGISIVGVLVMWLRFLVNYVVYGGEAIAYHEDTRRKLISDVFIKVAEEKKDPNPELLESLIEIREWYETNQANLLGGYTPVCFSKALSVIQKTTE